MSLYFDAVSVLTTASPTGGSFKSRLYSSRSLKASPAQIYALVTETSKWDILLKEVIENAGILKLEPKLTPLLSLLLVHDHLLSKRGIATPANHPIRQAVERHKTRLRAEFVKARVRRGCADLEQLGNAVRKEKNLDSATPGAVYPRWVRVNNVRTSLEKQLESTFSGYAQVNSLAELVDGEDRELPTQGQSQSRNGGKPNLSHMRRRLRLDPHIPDLLAVPPGADFSSSPAYKQGEIILQDKASCFPAYLLLGDGGEHCTGDLMDGCAAPGNKTTHLASLLAKQTQTQKATNKKASQKAKKTHIFSMDASPVRAKTLQKMVSAAGAANDVTVLPGQDFLALEHSDPRFANVTGLLLDPSCSGSGIIGRDDMPALVLPDDARGNDKAARSKNQSGKKRKRQNQEDENAVKQPSTTEHGPDPELALESTAENENENELSATTPLDASRLSKLSNIQSLIVEHALGFPAAQRVTYSTCSVHVVENEAVVARVLASSVARRRGWRVMRRSEQPEGLRRWGARGIRGDEKEKEKEKEGERVRVELGEKELEGCLRSWPGDEEGTGGFFVVGFVRDVEDEGDSEGEGEEEEEWEGFSD